MHAIEKWYLFPPTIPTTMSIPAAVKLIMINIYKYILWYDDFLAEKLK